MLIAVVDDDESVRESVPDLLRSFGLGAVAYATAKAFLASDSLDRTRCLILDVAMPEMSGPELQRELTRLGRSIPTVFITAHADAATRATLLAAGAVDCLFKPFSPEGLMSAVYAALRRD